MNFIKTQRRTFFALSYLFLLIFLPLFHPLVAATKVAEPRSLIAKEFGHFPHLHKLLPRDERRLPAQDNQVNQGRNNNQGGQNAPSGVGLSSFFVGQLLSAFSFRQRLFRGTKLPSTLEERVKCMIELVTTSFRRARFFVYCASYTPLPYPFPS
jgi:hypothetical protein